MKTMVVVLVAALTMPTAASALCFSPREMRAVAAVAAAPLVANVTARCASYPGGAPNLEAARPNLATRFRGEATGAAAIIAPQLGAWLGQSAADPTRIVAAVTPMLDLLLSSQVAKLGARTCRNIDDMAVAVVPLSDAQVVDILGAALVAAARDRPSLQFSLCEAPSR